MVFNHVIETVYYDAAKYADGEKVTQIISVTAEACRRTRLTMQRVRLWSRWDKTTPAAAPGG